MANRQLDAAADDQRDETIGILTGESLQEYAAAEKGTWPETTPPPEPITLLLADSRSAQLGDSSRGSVWAVRIGSSIFDLLSSSDGIEVQQTQWSTTATKWRRQFIVGETSMTPDDILIVGTAA
jgi:hypothetical protein